MKDKLGINIKRYCREHESRVRGALDRGDASEALLQLHLQKLRWIQHERLIHLIVVAMTVLAELFAVDLTVLHPETNPLAAAMMFVLAVLLGFYFAHYFFLENAVQRWYILAEQLRERIPE